MTDISDELRKVADEWDVTPLYKLADRIDAELVELPKDADGVPIHVGDTVYGCISGRKSQATELRLEDAWGILTNHGFCKPHIFTHTRPDSLEHIARDLEDWAEGNISGSAQSFANRIRELAKEDER